MADILQFTNALLDSANTVSNVVNDYQTKQANLSTQTKNIQLQNDINGQLARIRQSANFEDWNTQINDFFTQVKSGMSNKDSPYYCQNNLQAEQFTKILEQNQVNVSEQVGRMVEQRQAEKDILDVQSKKTMLAEMTAGQDYIDQANELDRLLYESGTITQEQYQQSKDQNYIKAYQNMYLKTFDASLDDALAQNKSFEAFYADIEKSVPELKATDTYGLERVMDKTSLNEAIKKTCQQNYKARLADIQQGNANNLSQIVQEMRQQNTAEGKVAAARRGQSAMNRMQGLKLSEQDRLQYSAIFELALGGDSLKGSGSGSGAKKEDFDKYSDILKAGPETYKQLVQDGVLPNYHEAVSFGAQVLRKEWYGKNYQENFDKDAAERDETYNLVYRGATSEETLSGKVFDLLLEEYPTAKDLVKENYSKLITDIQKHPDKYGDATVGELSEWMMDTLLGADANYSDEDFAKDFKNHINSCYAESLEYVMFDKKGEKLKKKFNANVAGDIAKAARLAQENDYVYTWQGQEKWAGDKKEALEAEGGVVDVLKNAVRSTLGLTDADLKENPIGFYYKPDPLHDDKTSTPIITYKNQAYEVIPDDDDKGFSLKEIHSDKIIKGTTGVKEAAAARKEAKAEAKAVEKEAAKDVATLKREREEESNKTIMETKATPTAMAKSNKLDYEDEWNHANDLDTKTSILRRVVTGIQKDAKNVDTGKKNSMSKYEFKQKYNIDYDEWIKDKEETRLFDLILKS